MSQVIYDTLTAKGLIGPNEMRDGHLVPREHSEYPKAVYIGDKTNFARGPAPKEGTDYVVVKNLREEAQILGTLPAPDPDDPLVRERETLDAERAKLAEERGAIERLQAEMRAELDQVKATRAQLIDELLHKGGVAPSPAPLVPPSVTKKIPVGLKVES